MPNTRPMLSTSKASELKLRQCMDPLFFLRPRFEMRDATHPTLEARSYDGARARRKALAMRYGMDGLGQLAGDALGAVLPRVAETAITGAFLILNNWDHFQWLASIHRMTKFSGSHPKVTARKVQMNELQKTEASHAAAYVQPKTVVPPGTDVGHPPVAATHVSGQAQLAPGEVAQPLGAKRNRNPRP